jgi:hypothetical protein
MIQIPFMPVYKGHKLVQLIHTNKNLKIQRRYTYVQHCRIMEESVTVL